jgi:hypothetical protein
MSFEALNLFRRRVHWFCVAPSILTIVSLAQASGTITVPAGSVDALASAIAQAGDGGKVLLAEGLHRESGSVLITQRVTILGEPGAILESGTSASQEPVSVVQAALHVQGADDVKISGIQFQAAPGQIGNTAILLERATQARIVGNSIEGFQFGVIVKDSERVQIQANLVQTSTAWQTGEIPIAHGIVVISGARARITANEVTGAFFAIWACDLEGTADRNVLHSNFSGLILCKVPDGAFDIGGDSSGAPRSAAGWKAHDNNAFENFDAGYLVIDGANNNRLVNNAAHANGTYDIELVGDSFRFGFLTPSSFENIVHVGSHRDLKIKDCGVGNLVDDEVVDLTTDPCF